MILVYNFLAGFTIAGTWGLCRQEDRLALSIWSCASWTVLFLTVKSHTSSYSSFSSLEWMATVLHNHCQWCHLGPQSRIIKANEWCCSLAPALEICEHTDSRHSPQLYCCNSKQASAHARYDDRKDCISISISKAYLDTIHVDQSWITQCCTHWDCARLLHRYE